MRFRRFVLFLVLAVATTGPAASPKAAAPPPPDPVDAVMKELDQVVDWYRHVTSLGQSPVAPQDLLYRDTMQQDAREAVRLSLEYARARAAVLSDATPTAGTPARGNARSQNLSEAAATAAQRVDRLRADLEKTRSQLATTQPSSAAVLQARRDKLDAELGLAVARAEVLSRLSGFMSGVDSGGVSGLLSKVDDLERSMPELREGVPSPATTRPANDAAVAGLGAFHPSSEGVAGLVGELFSISRELADLKTLGNQTTVLAQTSDKLRGPLRASLQDTMHRGDALATTQESSDTGRLAAERDQIRSLTSQFRLFAAVAVPLGEQGVYFNAVGENVAAWRGSLERQYRDILRRLAIRLGIMGSVILVILVVSSLWRRATFRYVSDTRRRRQFMLLRRIVVGAIIAVVIAIGFVTEFGSLATFAGILTAGIAVALQTVILSGVAYFFFIGRYGVRVGERITVSGVTGEVIDTGLFRLYLMELGGVNHLRPTGRVVVFSNSVLFQPSAFYKQLPGADYVWHEVALTLSPETDHRLAEARLLGAVESVFSGYEQQIGQQHAAIEAATHLRIAPPRPEGRLRFVDAGLEFVVRYPAQLREAEEIDDRVTRRLLEAIEQEPGLKLVASGTPKIQPAQ